MWQCIKCEWCKYKKITHFIAERMHDVILSGVNGYLPSAWNGDCTSHVGCYCKQPPFYAEVTVKFIYQTFLFNCSWYLTQYNNHWSDYMLCYKIFCKFSVIGNELRRQHIICGIFVQVNDLPVNGKVVAAWFTCSCIPL